MGSILEKLFSFVNSNQKSLQYLKKLKLLAFTCTCVMHKLSWEPWV